MVQSGLRKAWIHVGRSGLLWFVLAITLSLTLQKMLYSREPVQVFEALTAHLFVYMRGWRLDHSWFLLSSSVQRTYFEGDTSYWFENKDNSIPPGQMDFIFLIIFVPIIFACEMFTALVTGDYLNRFVAALRFSLGIFVSVQTTDLLVAFGKMHVGWLRPDFGDRCFGYSNLPPELDVFSRAVTTNDECLYNDDMDNLNSGRRSFPSGHTGNAVSGCVFLVLYFTLIAYRLKSSAAKQVLFFAALTPLSYGLYVGASRIFDNRHHPADVAAATLLACIVATMSFLSAMSLDKRGNSTQNSEWTLISHDGSESGLYAFEDEDEEF